MVRLAAGKSDVVVVVLIVVVVASFVLSTRPCLTQYRSLAVNFLSAYPHPALSDRVNLGDHVLEHAIATTCYEVPS